MAMKKCKECGTDISSSAKICPKCGKKLKHTGVRVAIGILVVILGLGIAFGGDTKTNIETNNEETTQTSTPAKTSVVTKENYDKINKGMSESEVQTILGEPQSTSENETPGVGTMILKHYQEAFSLKAIDIYFLSGKVYMKNWTEL